MKNDLPKKASKLPEEDPLRTAGKQPCLHVTSSVPVPPQDGPTFSVHEAKSCAQR